MAGIWHVGLALQVPDALAPLWLGPPGMAKTSLIREFCRDTMKLHLEAVISSIRDPSDFAGLPVPTENGIVLEPPAWAKRLAALAKDPGIEARVLHNGTPQGVLFLDEVGDCVDGAEVVTVVRNGRYSSLPIRDVRIGMHVVGFDLHSGRSRTNTVTRTYARGTEEVAVVRGRNHESIRATIDHKFLTQRGWIRVAELRQGDRIRYLPDLRQVNACYHQYTSSSTQNVSCDLPAEIPVLPTGVPGSHDKTSPAGSANVAGTVCDGFGIPEESEGNRQTARSVPVDAPTGRVPQDSATVQADHHADDNTGTAKREIPHGRISGLEKTPRHSTARSRSESPILEQPGRIEGTESHFQTALGIVAESGTPGTDHKQCTTGCSRRPDPVAAKSGTSKPVREADDRVPSEAQDRPPVYRGQPTSCSDSGWRNEILAESGLRTCQQTPSGLAGSLSLEHVSASGGSRLPTRELDHSTSPCEGATVRGCVDQQDPSIPGWIEVVSVTLAPECGVFDLTTEPDHNFFASGFLAHNCTPATQAALARVVHEHVVGDLALPLGIRVVAAANPPEEAASGWEHNPAFANRFVYMVSRPEDRPTKMFTSWLRTRESAATTVPRLDPVRWASEYEGTRRILAAFLDAMPSAAEESAKDYRGRYPRAFATWRTWDTAARLHAACRAVKREDELLDMISGCVGEPLALQYATFVRDMDLPDPEKVLRNPEEWTPDPRRPDRDYAIMQSVVGRATEGIEGREPKVDQHTMDRWLAAWRVIERGLKSGSKELVANAAQGLGEHRPAGGLLKPEIRSIIAQLAPILHNAGARA